MTKKNALLFAIVLSILPFGILLQAQKATPVAKKTANKAPTSPTQRLAFLHKRRAALIIRLQVINALVKKSKNLVKRLAFIGQRKRLTALAQKLNKLIAKAELALA